MEGDNGNVLRHRVAELEDTCTTERAYTRKLEERIRALETTQARLVERLTVFQAAQGIFTTIAATLAALFGRAG